MSMTEMLATSWAQVQELIDSALAEDMAFDDVTTRALIPGWEPRTWSPSFPFPG